MILDRVLVYLAIDAGAHHSVDVVYLCKELYTSKSFEHFYVHIGRGELIISIILFHLPTMRILISFIPKSCLNNEEKVSPIVVVSV